MSCKRQKKLRRKNKKIKNKYLTNRIIKLLKTFLNKSKINRFNKWISIYKKINKAKVQKKRNQSRRTKLK